MKTSINELLQNRHVAVVGAGLVGAGWAIVFARAGATVRIFDASAQIAGNVLGFIARQLEDMKGFGLVDEPDAILARISVSASLAEAVQDAGYIQESILERVPEKRALMAQLEQVVASDAVIGSSTSGIGASRFTQGSPLAARTLVVHPVNPPHLVPVVELVPSPATAQTSITYAQNVMNAVGQSPILVHKEVEGFVLNRLQGVLLREAWALVEEGVVSCEDLDKTVRDGLGWRWSFMGPFETIDLNAPGGIADYAARLGPLYQSIAESRTHERQWDEPLIKKVESERRQYLAAEDLAKRRDWRDKRLMAFAAARKGTTP